MGQSSGIAVLDKAVAVLWATSRRPMGLADLVEATGLPRATAYRLASALAAHRLLSKDPDGRWHPGPALREISHGAADPLLAHGADAVERLRDASGESAQLYVRDDSERICVLAAERAHGLRDTVPVGARLPMSAGSAAQVLAGWAGDADLGGLVADAAFSARELADVRARGWAQSVAEREAGVASVSAPVRDHAGAVIAAISVSGPIERLGQRPGTALAALVVDAAEDLAQRL